MRLQHHQRQSRLHVACSASTRTRGTWEPGYHGQRWLIESRAHLRASTNSCLCGHEAQVTMSSVEWQLCPLFITLLLIAIWAWYRSSAVLHRFLLGTIM